MTRPARTGGRPRAALRLATAALLALAAAGCGQKGPLTLPGDGASAGAPAAETTPERDEDDGRDDE